MKRVYLLLLLLAAFTLPAAAKPEVARAARQPEPPLYRRIVSVVQRLLAGVTVNGDNITTPKP